MTLEHEQGNAPTPDGQGSRPGDPHDVSRRGVLRGTAVGALALPVLAACGSDNGSSGGGSQDSGSGGSGGSGGGGGDVLTSTNDVPVDGGTILNDQQVVVTQPAQGDFKAFSAICTHQGCIVSEVSGGAIICGCHGSEFSIKDGSVLQGPATAPLEAVDITVKGGNIDRA